MGKFRTYQSKIITCDGELIIFEYKSFYPIGSRGNWLDFVWRAENNLDVPVQNPNYVESIYIKYLD